MKEIIKTITEWSGKANKDSRRNIDGFKIITNKQEIKIGMDMEVDCCEEPGYFWSNDDYKEFEGAELNSIEIVDEELNKKKLEAKTDGGMYEGGTMFVNFNTDKGVLQFTAYNKQSGYYGHSACVISEQLIHEEVI